MQQDQRTDLPDIFQFAGNEVKVLFSRWNLFCELFRVSDDRVRLLVEAAPAVAWCLQDGLLEATLLTICKLTDPARTGSRKNPKDNLTFERILEDVRDAAQKEPPVIFEREQPVDADDYITRERAKEHKKIPDELQIILDELGKKREKIIDHRNKRIAHLDLEVALKPETLDPFELSTIDEALVLLNKFMCRAHAFYTNVLIDYQEIRQPLNASGARFTELLKLGLEKRHAKNLSR